MISEFELIKQYQRACEYAIKKEKLAYGLEWSFVKNLICRAYKIEKVRNTYPDSENDNINVRLIDDNIDDSTIRDIMHGIRAKRNTYEHGNYEYLEAPKINEIKKDLDDIINYINNDSNNDFQFVGKYRTFRIEQDIAESENSLKQIFEIEEKPYSYTIYNNAYSRENSYFIVNQFVDKCKNSIFAVIHNLLIRSDNIKINNLILEEKLTIYEKQEVYKFQIALLTLMAKSEHYQFSIQVAKDEEKVAKVALKNIMYYYEIISKMAGKSEKVLLNCTTSNKLTSGNLVVNEETIHFSNLISGKDENLVNNSHVFISNAELKYKFNAENEKYYNILVNEIFGIEKFRTGQIETLKELFKDNRPLMSILPTGYGKSLIYQFVAMIYPKIMWIVSPDEFLVNDQISNLNDKNIYRVSYITDIGTLNPRINLNPKQIPTFRANMNYITAEGIMSDKIMRILRNLADEDYISAISVDECHKTSIWGHQFSSRYATLIRQLTEYVPECKFLLLSATVATRVKKEILGQIANLKTLQPCPLKRDNIKYDINSFENIEDIVDYIEKRYNESSSLAGETSDLSVVINNDERILSEIMSRLKQKDGLLDKCFMFDGTVASYEEFKISHRAILFVSDDYLTGINVNNLNNLFIVGMPINKEWFYQQSGRVGRYLKDGFVSVLLLNEENTFIDNIVNNKLDPVDNVMIKKCINHTNLTGLTNSSFEYDEEIIKTTCKIIEEIKNCIFVPTGQTQGRVIGRIPNGMFGVYDMPLYILLYMGIVKSLRYLQEEELDITYRVYVEPDIDTWLHSSKEKVRKNIMYESYNEEIEKVHLYHLERVENTEDIVKVVLHWLDVNSSKLKKEMFKNIYKLIMQNIKNADNEYIENDLTNYFAVGSSNMDYEIEESYSNVKVEETLINSIEGLEFNDYIQDNIIEDSKTMTIEKNEEQDNVSDSSKVMEEMKEENNIEEKENVKKEENIKNNDKEKYSIIGNKELSDIVKNAVEKALKQKEKSNEKNNNSNSKIIQESKNNKENYADNEDNQLVKFLNLNPENLEIIISIVKEDIIKHKCEFKAHIERSIEEKYSKICLVALCVYELLDEKEKMFMRLNELNQADRTLFYTLLDKIKEDIDLTRMYWIDKFLIKNNYAFSFIPLKYYVFYGINRNEEDIINDIELNEDKIPRIEEVLKCIYNQGEYITALKGLSIIDINYKKLSSLDNFEKLVETDNYLTLLEVEKNILTKREKIIIDETLKNKNKNRYYYPGFLGLIKILIEK